MSIHSRELELRAKAREIFDAGLAASDPERLVSERLEARDNRVYLHPADGSSELLTFEVGGGGRLRVFGAGKAACSLASAVERVVGKRVHDGRVIVKTGHGTRLSRIVVEEASHPLPDAKGMAATKRLLDDVEGGRENDLVLFLLTGGASALLVAPAEGLSLDDKVRTNELLIRSGATIREINTVRKHLSAVKGGQLLERFSPASVLALVISDVLGDDLSSIGSGPAVPDPTTFEDALHVLERYELNERVPPSVRSRLTEGAAGRVKETPKPGADLFERAQHVVLASNRHSLAACVARSRALGFDASIFAEDMDGDVHERAEAFVRMLLANRSPGTRKALLAGGELTLRVTGKGKGGRSQEFALVAARALALAGARASGVAVLASGTDGTDGPTDAAGAIVDGLTVARAERLGLDTEELLRDNDSYSYFDGLGDLLKTGPTGTNVNDLVVGLTTG